MHSSVAHSSSNLLAPMANAFEATFFQPDELDAAIRAGDQRKAQLATPEWNDAMFFGLDHAVLAQQSPTAFVQQAMTAQAGASSYRLNVKTHVFKKELQEYVPTQIEDRLRIETIIYVELSLVDQAKNGAMVNSYEFVRLPKNLFFVAPDKVMSETELATKKVLSATATLQCPSNGWQEETEACMRCARRMSAKLDEPESRIIHLLPELYRTENGDALISFRNGIANIQLKINCYCGHKKEKEGFVVRFDAKGDNDTSSSGSPSIDSHITLPLMFYHQNKNRVASRAAAAAAKAAAKAEQQQQQQVSGGPTRNTVKSVTSKKAPKTNPLPSPANSLLDSPNSSSWQDNSLMSLSNSPEMSDFGVMNVHDMSLNMPSPPPPDPLISLFPDLLPDSSTSSLMVQESLATVPEPFISHMTPNSGPTRGGTLVTIHGAHFKIGEVIYVCFGAHPVPVLPTRDHMLEVISPPAQKAEMVSVFLMNSATATATVVDTTRDHHHQATYTYVDDNEKELIKLALQRMMNISARLEGPVDTVVQRATEFTNVWSSLLLEDGQTDNMMQQHESMEQMVLQSLQLLDGPTSKNTEGLSIVNSTGHTMLHLAAMLSFKALAFELLSRGIEAEIVDKNGLRAVDLAKMLNDQPMETVFNHHNQNNGDKSAEEQMLTKMMMDIDHHDVVASTTTTTTITTDGIAAPVTGGASTGLFAKDGVVAQGAPLLVSPGSGQNHYPLEETQDGVATDTTDHRTFPAAISPLREGTGDGSLKNRTMFELDPTKVLLMGNKGDLPGHEVTAITTRMNRAGQQDILAGSRMDGTLHGGRRIEEPNRNGRTDHDVVLTEGLVQDTELVANRESIGTITSTSPLGFEFVDALGSSHEVVANVCTVADNKPLDEAALRRQVAVQMQVGSTGVESKDSTLTKQQEGSEGCSMPTTTTTTAKTSLTTTPTPSTTLAVVASQQEVAAAAQSEMKENKSLSEVSAFGSGVAKEEEDEDEDDVEEEEEEDDDEEEEDEC